MGITDALNRRVGGATAARRHPLVSALFASLIAANAALAANLWLGRQELSLDPVLSSCSQAAARCADLLRKGGPFLLVTLDARGDRSAYLNNILALGPKMAAVIVVRASSAAPAMNELATANVVDVTPAEMGASWSTHLGWWDQWYVFNRQGERIRQGSLWTGGLPGALQQAAGKGDSFDFELRRLVVAGEMRGEFEIEKRRAAAADDGVHLALFVQDVNTDCPTGRALTQIGATTLQGRAPDRFSIYTPSHWADEKLAALKWTFPAAVGAKRATRELSDEWRELSEIFGSEAADIFMVAFSRESAVQIYARDALVQALRLLTR